MPIGSVDWIEDGMLREELRPLGADRYEFDVRNQFFHGAHPLGWIRGIEVSVDGVPADDVSLTVRAQRVPLELVRTTSDIWWYPLETAAIGFRLPAGVSTGSPHVRCRFDVSTFFFTPAIDRDDRYPTMTLNLAGDLRVATETTA